MSWRIDNQEALSRLSDALGETKDAIRRVESVYRQAEFMSNQAEDEELRIEAKLLKYYIEFHILIPTLREMQRHLKAICEMLKEKED